MASVYSTRFLGFRGASGDQTYVVPAGNVAVLRDIDVVVTEPPVEGSTINVLGEAGQLVEQYVVDPLTSPSFSFRGRIVYYAGEQITLQLGTGTDGHASGYLLELP